MTIRLDGRVAIVTGGGAGLGRAHALALAARGAAIVVNDMSETADAVAAEICASGGRAIAVHGDVTNVEQMTGMAERTLSEFDRIDILVNNAGILRDKSFTKMTIDEFKAVIDVHLIGSAICTKAVWAAMCAQTYGRIVMTTSASGLFGSFGQTNYGAAKLGLVGLMHSLTQEGQKYGIRINSLAPMAATQMTRGALPPEWLGLLEADKVTPALIYLASEDAPSNTVISAGAGAFSKTVVVDTPPVLLEAANLTPEEVAARLDSTDPLQAPRLFASGSEQVLAFVELGSRGGVE